MNYTRSILRFVSAIALAAVAFGPVAALAAPPKPTASPIVAKCKADLARRLEMRTADVTLVSAQPVTWPDASLGMPESGKMYIQVLTPGFRVTLKARNTSYLYATSSKAIKYAGPTLIWGYSVLYTKPIKNEPNLNADLYQCSLLGTNSIRIASGISDIYPQAKGTILATSRTSRSGFDLLYLKAARNAKPRTISSAYAFAGAALNDKQDKWAAIVKPRLGAEWTVVVAPIANPRNSHVLPMPTGPFSAQIAWSSEKLMILPTAAAGAMSSAFETTPASEKPEWKQVGAYLFPGPEYMLNKSQTLVIDEGTVNGKPGVEVVKKWFTGSRDVVARLEGVKLKKYDFVMGRFVNVWGTKDSKPVFYTVDIATDEVIRGVGISTDSDTFLYPPLSSPLAVKKK